MKRDQIDFRNAKIPALFRSIFLPTLLGMVCMSVMTMIDGAFVGHGVGSDGLAAVNIFCPLWLIMSGIGLMFGIGCSVVSSIHLSQNNLKAAHINVTQAFMAGTIALMVWLVTETFSETVAKALGASDRLLPYVLDYQRWLSRSFPAIFLQSVGLMVIRLDGSPKYAMFCSSLPSIVNVVLDYVFLFIFHQGLEGVAIATAIGCWTGGIMVIVYILFLRQTIRLYKIKASLTSLKLTVRNLNYQMRLGFSAMLGDLFIAVLMFVGNYVFLKYLKEDGVAAYSVACYIFPFIFMTGNAIAQSAQPIISFNYGAGSKERVKEALTVALKVGLVSGMLVVLCTDFFIDFVVGIFVEAESNAAHIAKEGIPWLSICFIPYILNVVLIGYHQSIENAKQSTIYAFLRGFVLMIPCFLILPPLIGETGMWLAMPLSELISLLLIVSVGWKWYV
ncbi:MAG: MATE family efflux transporter [Paludibacteraceae bacterium]|nr:MATE family efflux transporter [Paludibacteraceae bacterium]MBR6105504.1 MATE family efflux transporter [Paludibacteraceae bacterium]